MQADLHPNRTRVTARKWLIPVLPVLLVAALTGAASLHHPCPPAKGTTLNGPACPAKATETLRVCSFNIHGCRDAQGSYDLDGTAACLQNADFVGLNEVHGGFPWQAGDQAELLGRKLEMQWLFAPTTFRWGHDDFGNGVLSAHPIALWRRDPLPCTQGKKFRNTVLVEVLWRERTVTMFVTHLDRVRDREAQLGEVFAQFLSLPKPCVLMGDLNSPANDPQVRRLLTTPDVHDAVSEGLDGNSPRRIDWIITRGLKTISAGIIEEGASDHPCVWAELMLP